MARPTGYKSDYPKILLDLMKDGKKGVHLHAHFGINRKTFLEWRKKYPEFEEAYEIGWEECEKWWEDFGRMKMLEGDEKGFKYWISYMNKNFGWANKGEGVGGATINIGRMNVFQGQSKNELIENIENMLKDLPINAEFEVVEEIPALIENPREDMNGSEE